MKEPGTQNLSVRWAAALSKRLDAFVPVAFAAGTEEALRARMASGFAFLMCAVFAVLAVVHVAAGRWQEGALNAKLSVVTLLAPFAMRSTGRYLTVLNTTLGVCLVTLTFIAVTERGPGISAPTVGLAEIPLFATLLAGVRVGTIWGVLSCVASISVGVAATELPTRVRPVERFNDHVVLVIVTWTLLLVAALYERGRERQLARISDLDARRHAAELERMTTVSEVRVAQAERLASLGRVAAAVAHEINNPLAYVLANLEYLAGAEGDGAETKDALREAIGGARIVTRIVADLYDLTRAGGDESGAADVVRAIDVALKMARPHLRRATVERTLPSQLFVRGDAVRLTQVFLNLFVNAAHAMREAPGSDNKVFVTTRTIDDRLLIEVTDTGKGIPPELIERITDEFFTTKPTGEGMGLGLALSYTSLARMGGRLEFESAPGKTTARVWLTPAEAPPAPEVIAPPAVQSRRRVLIVEDEISLGKSLARLLRAHDVTVATSGREALSLVQSGEAYDVVLCDIMMPDVSGMDVYEALEAERPEWLSRFVFMTGGTFTARAHEFRARVPNLFVAKPIDAATLRSLVELGGKA